MQLENKINRKNWKKSPITWEFKMKKAQKAKRSRKIGQIKKIERNKNHSICNKKITIENSKIKK